MWDKDRKKVGGNEVMRGKKWKRSYRSEWWRNAEWGKKKDEGEDYRAGVRENQAAALQAPVNPILITSQCVEHQLFFDPFVMISIQPVRTVPIQNGFCRISRYCVTVCLTKHSLESCISNSLPHVCMCAIRSARAAHCFWKVPYFCV